MKFKVSIEELTTYEIIVKADSTEKAEELAREKLRKSIQPHIDFKWHLHTQEVGNVEEMK